MSDKKTCSNCGAELSWSGRCVCETRRSPHVTGHLTWDRFEEKLMIENRETGEVCKFEMSPSQREMARAFEEDVHVGFIPPRDPAHGEPVPGVPNARFVSSEYLNPQDLDADSVVSRLRAENEALRAQLLESLRTPAVDREIAAVRTAELLERLREHMDFGMSAPALYEEPRVDFARAREGWTGPETPTEVAADEQWGEEFEIY